MRNNTTLHIRTLSWLDGLRRLLVRSVLATHYIDHNHLQRFHCAFHKVYREFAALHPE